MTQSVTERLMTAGELLALPDDGWKYELIEGRLVRVSPSSTWSSAVSANALTLINGFVRPRRLGVCGDADWGFVLGTDPDLVRSPDVAFVSAERIPASGLPKGFWHGAPDLAVEVRSPSDRTADVLRKVAEFLEAGTRLVWVLDPERRSAVVYRADGTVAAFGADGILDGEDVLPGFSLALAEVWV